MMELIWRLMGQPRDEREPPEPPHDVIAVRFEWSGNCCMQKSMPAQTVPRKGDTVTILTEHLVIEGEVERVRWVITDGEPNWEYIPGRAGRKGTFGRARAKAFVELADTRHPRGAAGWKWND